MIHLLIDNGHGYNTPGKCSPDKSYYEWDYTRRLADILFVTAEQFKLIPHFIVDEAKDISLSTRVKRINSYCDTYGSINCVMLSLHSNASTMGDSWGSARGVSIWTTKSQNNSDKLAAELWYAGERILGKGYMNADWSDKDPDFESNFTIIKGAKCPSVLIENHFHDNKEDLELLKNSAWRSKLALMYCEGIVSYESKYLS